MLSTELNFPLKNINSQTKSDWILLGQSGRGQLSNELVPHVKDGES